VKGSTQLTVTNSSSEAAVSVVMSGTQNENVVVNSGTMFSVDVRVDNVTDLGGWAFGLRWNSSLLQLVNVTEGPFLQETYPTIFIATNNPAYTKMGYFVEINDIAVSFSGVSGSGVLATFTFQSIGVGNGTIALANIDGGYQLYGPASVNINSPPTLIPFIASNCSVSVTTPQYSPVDFYHDGTVNFNDIVYFVRAYIHFNQDGTLDSACDLNNDGKINFQDLQLFVQDYIAYG
jgi:hypothetical protein